MGSPAMQPPPTPTPQDSDVLLPPSSPDVSSSSQIPKIRHPPPSPIRLITPVNSNDHPLKSADLLSPPVSGANRQKRRSRAPAPTPIDLPTRADMQAMSAISLAESSGLRGGWIMNTDASSSSAHRRSQASSSISSGASRSSNHAYRASMDAEMVDIDLEGGKGDPYGSPRMSSEDQAAQQRDERLSIAGLEHRRMSPVTSPHTSRPNSPSPLSIQAVPFDRDITPRATPREEHVNMSVPQSSFAAISPIRPPPRLGSHSDRGMRATTPDGEGKDKELIRNSYRPRNERESSVASVDSQEGLLGDSAASSRANSPPPFISPASSPTPTDPIPSLAPVIGAKASSPTTASFASNDSSDSVRAPLTGNTSRHKPTGSIVAQRRKALEDAMGGLDIKGKK